MVLVVVRESGGAASLDRQCGLCATQRLNLALLVDAENQGVLGWVQVQPDDVKPLVLKAGIARDLEVQLKCGFKRLLRDAVRTVVAPIPKCSASVRVLQCVA